MLHNAGWPTRVSSLHSMQFYSANSISSKHVPSRSEVAILRKLARKTVNTGEGSKPRWLRRTFFQSSPCLGGYRLVNLILGCKCARFRLREKGESTEYRIKIILHHHVITTSVFWQLQCLHFYKKGDGLCGRSKTIFVWLLLEYCCLLTI